MTLREMDVPSVGPDEVLIQVAYSGICGSELSGFLGQNSLRTPPLVFGHELSGWIASVGARAASAGLEVGARVTANPLVGCDHCRHCLAGRQHLCGARLLLGASLPGCNAEFVAVPASAVVVLPDAVSLRDAAMTEPAACAVRAVEVSGANAVSSALVVGAGPIGLFILQVLAAHGVTQRYVVERNPARRAMAEQLGATALATGPGSLPDLVRLATDGEGVDVAFDAVGAVETRRDCFASTARGGRVLFVGLHADETSLPINQAIRSEISMVGVFGYTPVNFRTALHWLSSGRIGLREGVVVAPLADGSGWYERLVAGDAASKVLLQPTAAGEEQQRRA
jgi:2-desacetyl-2-hydroxyethyl bacteriochlorophyllide A dehydrogenase